MYLQRIMYRLTMYGPEQVDSSSNMTYIQCASLPELQLSWQTLWFPSVPTSSCYESNSN